MARIIAIFTELNCFWIHGNDPSYSDRSSGGRPPSPTSACCQCCHSCGKLLSHNGQVLSQLTGSVRHRQNNTLPGLSPLMSNRSCLQYSPAAKTSFTATHASLSLECTSMVCVNMRHQPQQHDKAKDTLIKSVQLISCRNMKSYSLEKRKLGLNNVEKYGSVAMVGYSTQNDYGIYLNDEEVLLRGLGILLGQYYCY